MGRVPLADEMDGQQGRLPSLKCGGTVCDPRGMLSGSTGPLWMSLEGLGWGKLASEGLQLLAGALPTFSCGCGVWILSEPGLL